MVVGKRLSLGQVDQVTNQWFADTREVRDDLQRLSRSSAPQPVVRWLAASLLATTRFWYRRALSFVTEGEIPAYLDVPELAALP